MTAKEAPGQGFTDNTTSCGEMAERFKAPVLTAKAGCRSEQRRSRWPEGRRAGSPAYCEDRMPERQTGTPDSKKQRHNQLRRDGRAV
jgi:hypothetical protein